MKNKSKPIEIPGRRDFFIKMALASVATTLPPFVFSSCENNPAFQGTGLAPFKVWEEMLHALKSSPDFLPQRVENLIATKDLEAMYNFVKNEITLIPTAAKAVSYYDLGNGHKWGIAGVLRCGMATAREKADLLCQMYEKAGIAAKVVYERTSIKENEVPAFFYRPFDRVFHPEITSSQLKKWNKQMGDSEKAIDQKEFLKDYSEPAIALADSITKELPNIEEFGDTYNFKWDNYKTPTVEFTIDNITQYAHLFDPKTLFGEKHNSLNGKIIKSEPIKENTEKVSIKVTYSNTVNPSEVRNLIEGEWSATSLIGKQVQLSFVHGLTIEEQAVTPIGNLRVFTPALALQAVDESLEYVEQHSFLSDPITLEGKRIPISKDKVFGINGNEIIAKTNLQLQKEVQKITVIPTVAGYPYVKLSIDARDASDQMIEGLSANDFKITDNGQPVRALLENNQRTPKILVLSDQSGSMPKAYNKEGLKKFNAALEQKIKENYPAAIIDYWGTPSSLFTWLLKASQTDYDLVLFATDGHNDDKFDEKNLSAYQTGPPTIILNVYDYENGYLDTFNKMAEISNGVVLNANNQEAVLEEINTYIEKMEFAPYVFSYTSVDDTKIHDVAVTIDKERLKATGTFTIPDVLAADKNGIAGVYLELKVGNKKPIKRVLAGWDPVVDYYTKPKNSDVDAVQQLFLGGVMLAVEGEGPTLSAALVDLLKSKLSNRNWGEAYIENDIKKAKQALSKGTIHIPAILIPMLAPLQNQVTTTSITYATGYRMCLLKTTVGLDCPSSFSFDYLSTSYYETMAKNKEERFLTTLKKTAQLAIREGTLFEKSTYATLNSSTLIDSKTANKEDWKSKVMDSNHKDYQYWNNKILRGEYGYTKLFDSTADTKEFWRLNSWSGEIYGMLPDGSGGGGNSIATQLNKMQTVLKMYMAVFARMAGVGAIGATSLSIVATYGKTLVQLYAIVSEAIMVMDTTGMDEKVAAALKNLAFSVAKDILFGVSGGAGFVMSGLDDLISLMVDTDPF